MAERGLPTPIAEPRKGEAAAEELGRLEDRLTYGLLFQFAGLERGKTIPLQRTVQISTRKEEAGFFPQVHFSSETVPQPEPLVPSSSSVSESQAPVHTLDNMLIKTFGSL